jgi:hypothetical protein
MSNPRFCRVFLRMMPIPPGEDRRESLSEILTVEKTL